MNGERSKRTEMLIGKEGIERLAGAHVAVFGIGGVGSYVAESLARSGVGHITLVDADVVSESNINRQLIALTSTLGKYKTDVMAQRIKDIDPECEVSCERIFYSESAPLDVTGFDYVADAIDTVSSKLFLIKECKRVGVNIISCMGTGNKLDPSLLRVGDIYETKGCPLARVMRKKLREANIASLDVVYSLEESSTRATESAMGRHAPGSISFVPGCAGLMLAGRIVRNIIG